MEKMPKFVPDKDEDVRRAHDIIKAVEEEKYSFDICEWACKSFANIAGVAMLNQNTDAMADFLDDGACETMISIMNKYAASSEIIAYYCCLTICMLAWSLREMKEFLGEIGACELVVFCTSMHVGDPLVSEFGSGAIGLLAKHNNSNSFRLAESGACDVISQVGNFGFNVRHDKCIDVATNVCHAICQLAEATNAKRLLECGADCLIVELLKIHKKDEEFASAAVKALCSLASLNFSHREELGRVGGCELVIDVSYLHDIVTLSRDACEAILHLSLSSNNSVKLGEAGACGMLCYSLKMKLMDYEFGAEICSGAMLNLATYGYNAKANREKLTISGAVELLRKAQLSTKVSYKARENIVSLLEMLGAEMIPGSTSNSHRGSTADLKPIAVVNGSQAIGNTIPLQIEVRETVKYSSFHDFPDHHHDDSKIADSFPRTYTYGADDQAPPENGIYEI